MKKLYGEFEREDWLKVSDIRERDIPDTVILHGEDGSITENLAEWEEHFEEVLCRPRWNMFVGRREKRKVGFVNVCWAPMAALIVHKYAMLGTQRFIQIGFCGGLSEKLQYGEVLVVSHAKGEEGVAANYLPSKNLYSAHPPLIENALSLLNQWQVPHRAGRVVSTSTMFLETNERVKKWSSEGYLGVDGEVATTFAVAERFGAEASGLLTCSDNLVLGHNIWQRPEDVRAAEDAALEKIQQLALELAQL